MPQNKIVLRQNKSILRKIPYHFTDRGGKNSALSGSLFRKGRCMGLIGMMILVCLGQEMGARDGRGRMVGFALLCDYIFILDIVFLFHDSR